MTHRFAIAAAMTVLSLSGVLGAESEAKKSGGPLPPAQALASFQVEPGVRVELAAAEPLVMSPVAVAFDERGRMYVAEDRGYPTGPAEGQPPVGVVALLEDTNADGSFDRRHEFATGLSFPNGVMPWKGGVLVTCSPDILYLKDTDGDGRADVREVVLTGFSLAQSTQLRTSHPTLGLDNWVYVTSGLVGGEVKAPARPDLAPLKFTGDLRFRPDGSAFEAASGRGQFGLAFDDFGRRFVCSNRQPAQHVVFEPHHLARNPYLPITDPVQDVAAANEQAKVFPLTEDTTTASYIPSLLNTPHAGTFTSACGLAIFRGDALTPDHAGNIFVCEPAQNLVQRQVMRPDGASFVSQRPYEGRDFLASTDTWFRPVFAAHGPDGALYICDMYRKVIDHPDYLPKEVRGGLDFEAGKDRGRIYRLVAADRKPNAERLDLGSQGIEALCAKLDAPNGWVRDTARRLLLERRDPTSISLLQAAVTGGKTPFARAAAIWTLEGFGAVDHGLIEQALKDPHPGVREQAVRLIEQQLAVAPADEKARWTTRLIELAGDPDPRVRFHTALALAATSDAAVIPALARIAASGAGDRWTRAAVLSGVTPDPEGFLDAVLPLGSASPDALAAMLHDLGRMFGAGLTPEQSLRFLLRVTGEGAVEAGQSAAVAGLGEGLRSRGFGGGAKPPLVALVESDSPQAKAAGENLARLRERQEKLALDRAAPPPSRIAAVTLLGELATEQTTASLASLLAPEEPAELQLAAARALGRSADPTTGEALVAAQRWSGYTPAVRDAVVTALMSNARQLPAMLAAMERGEIPTWALDPARRDQLMRHADAAIKTRAEKLFKSGQTADRQKVYEQYKSVLALKPDGRKGHEVFLRVCAACHTYQGEGAKVGPDLTGVRNQPAEALLLHILIPEYEIVPGFTGYLVQTKDGRAVSGLIAGETETSLTLRLTLGQEETILRGNIAAITALGLSLMPQELEKAMTEQEMADLIGFLKGQ